MTRGAALLCGALFLLLSCGIARAGGHVYQNGTDGGVGTAISFTNSAVAVLVPARPGARRYDLLFQCTAAVNVAWGTGSYGPASPAPTTSTGIPVSANAAWGNTINGDVLITFPNLGNWDRELDVIGQAGSGTCVTYEATVN